MRFKPRRLCRTGDHQRWQSITIPSVVTHMWESVEEIDLEYFDSDTGGYLVVHPRGLHDGSKTSNTNAAAKKP